jgi:hypothetical protein
MIIILEIGYITYLTLIIGYAILFIVDIKFNEDAKEKFATGVEHLGLFRMIILAEVSIFMFPATLIYQIIKEKEEE